MRRLLAMTVCAAVVLVGCAAAGGSVAPSIVEGLPTPGVSASPGSSEAPVTGDLRLDLIDHFGPRWYCDPDEFPVAHGDDLSNAIARFPDMQAEGVVYGAVLRRLGLSGQAFSDAQKVAIYRLWKVAVSLPLVAQADGTYTFDYVAMPVGGATAGLESVGTIDTSGSITVSRQVPVQPPNCPI